MKTTKNTGSVFEDVNIECHSFVMEEINAEPLDYAIRLWRERLRLLKEQRIYVKTGARACPLCFRYITNIGCRGCPVSNATGRSLCQGSPYVDVDQDTTALVDHAERPVVDMYHVENFLLPNLIESMTAEVTFLETLQEAQ
jgi:hypothetical protein